MCPFADQVPLELGQRREHMKNQFACCAAGFDFLRKKCHFILHGTKGVQPSSYLGIRD